MDYKTVERSTILKYTDKSGHMHIAVGKYNIITKEVKSVFRDGLIEAMKNFG